MGNVSCWTTDSRNPSTIQRKYYSTGGTSIPAALATLIMFSACRWKDSMSCVGLVKQLSKIWPVWASGRRSSLCLHPPDPGQQHLSGKHGLPSSDAELWRHGEFLGWQKNIRRHPSTHKLPTFTFGGRYECGFDDIDLAWMNGLLWLH